MIFALIGIGMAGCSEQKSSYDYFSQARQYYEEGKDKAAVIEIKNALQKDPENGEARYLYAKILNENGDGSAAEIQSRKALTLGVSKARAYSVLGESLLLQRKFQNVLDEIKPSNEFDGEQLAGIQTIRGDAYIALGKDSEAASAYQKAIDKNPDYTKAHLGLARLAALENDLEGALRYVDIALSKSPENAQAWLMKAGLLREQGKNEKARAAYSHILQFDEKNISAHLGLVSMDLAAGRPDAARANLEAAKKIAPGNLRVKYMQAVLYFRDEKYHEAHDTLQEVMKAAPEYMPGVLLTGAISYQLGSYEQARQYLSKFLAEFPDNSYANNLLAAVYLQLNQPAESLKFLDRLLGSTPENPGGLALAGEALMRAKDFAKASEYLEKAASIEPENAAFRAQLGASRLGSGDIQRAIEDLETATAMDDKEARADALLVIVYLSKGQYDKALTSAQAWEDKQPENPIVYYLEGASYAAKKDFDNARKHFEKAVEKQSDYYPAIFNLARLDLQEKNYEEARKRLVNFLKIEKENTHAMMSLAKLAAINEDEEEYVRWLKQAAEAQPDNILPYIKLVDYYLVKDSGDKALRAAQQAVNSNLNSPEALDLLGATQIATNDNEAALATYTNLVEIAPKSPIAYMRLALAQLALKKMTEARESLNQALELKPDFLKATDALIRLNLVENKVDDALRLSRKLQTQQPDSPAGYNREADILVLQKRYSQAVSAYEEALARGADSAALIKFHRALISAGDDGKAERRLTSWINQNPDDVLVRSYAANHYMATNRNRDAIDQYEALLEIAPRHALAPLNNLAGLYQREGDIRRALEMAERAFKLAPENPSVQDTLGWVLVEQGELERAITLLRKASKAAPDEGVIRYHLAVALARSGQEAAAKKELQAAINTDQKFPGLADAKAMLKDL